MRLEGEQVGQDILCTRVALVRLGLRQGLGFNLGQLAVARHALLEHRLGGVGRAGAWVMYSGKAGPTMGSRVWG